MHSPKLNSPFYSTLIGLLVLQVFFVLIYKIISLSSDPFLFYRNWETLFVLVVIVVVLIELAVFIFMTIHFRSIKKIFPIIMMVATTVVGFWAHFEFQAALRSLEYSQVLNKFKSDFARVDLTNDIQFWCSVFHSVAFILADDKKWGWLALSGASTVVINSLVQIYIANASDNLIYLFILLSTVPGIFIIFYFWDARKKCRATV
jgi:hypothetical protein